MNRIRTYTEERSDPEISQIGRAVDHARVVLVLGFGYHNQNIEILRTNRAAWHVDTFMTVQGIGVHNHQAVLQKMKSALNAIEHPQCLPVEAKSLMREFGTSIALAVS